MWRKSGNEDRASLLTLYDRFRGTGRVLLVGDHNCMELKGFIGRCRFFCGCADTCHHRGLLLLRAYAGGRLFGKGQRDCPGSFSAQRSTMWYRSKAWSGGMIWRGPSAGCWSTRRRTHPAPGDDAGIPGPEFFRRPCPFAGWLICPDVGEWWARGLPGCRLRRWK